MSTSLSINRQNGNVPKSLPGEDHITGLVIYMAAGDIPASFKTERVQPLSTIDAAEAAGIVDYTTAADGTQTAAPVGCAGASLPPERALPHQPRR